MTHSILTRLAAPVAATLLLTSSAICGGGDKLYAVSAADAVFRQVDPVTLQTIASATMSAPTYTLKYANGLATHPGTGEVYVLLTPSSGTGRLLGKVAPSTGAVTIVGNTGDKFAGLAFSASGTLYGITGKGATFASTLYSISTTTAQPTAVKTFTGGDYGESIAFDPNNGRVLRFSGDSVQVFESFDLTTLTSTTIPLTGDHISEALSMIHVAGDNFLVTDLNDDLFVLNRSGQAKQVGTLAFTAAKGLAFSNPPASGAYLKLYGNGLPATGGLIPTLCAGGTPSGGSQVNLGVFNGPGGVPVVLAIGLSNISVPVSPTCVLQNFPIVPTTIVLNLSGTQPGEGAASVPLTIPNGVAMTDLYFQAVAVEVSLKLVSSNPIQFHIQ